MLVLEGGSQRRFDVPDGGGTRLIRHGPREMQTR
ncbi:hypothetical protein P296_04485 [Salmonella enterica subsp. arizonae serovar 18:z4,z23:- str. CVM N26624]|uniref:Uncharacterized protein n=1 Tax=Salmonella enterica subsp. arizonae serovar 18:z4,z23:- str. CVM N26626 TaxID=1395119 RepID=A0A3S5YR42_SALER|nr:hypothetical protein N898_10100 [Salmonella enterica subsp. arizonae serovar 62:z36:- str. RKS2983]OLV92847.1 hypothetical protein P296_04485 [Salmonella enterica subsp. arizonae serovar 18:z4,z23:- str. CVM N26624]OLV99343.1 hypothetical protein P297_14170 [Salmonella enterica subsp. arizonae serovar 18:z4,z23:- str. CVM N26625]OLW05156.1 hypothetical protein P298_06085 [Salmonella enterica subsp. arizonae serovar 18:z4,z23:- str. CVM N26626]OLW12619.1 hypothetical protein P295_07400 [Salmo